MWQKCNSLRNLYEFHHLTQFKSTQNTRLSKYSRIRSEISVLFSSKDIAELWIAKIVTLKTPSHESKRKIEDPQSN